MIFTPDQIQELLKVIEFHHIFFIGNNIGPSVLSEIDKNILRANGIDLDKLISEDTNLISQAFKFGVLAAALGDKNTKTLTYDDFSKYIKRGEYIPLVSSEKYALEALKTQAYNDIKGLGNKISKDVGIIHIEASEEQRREYEKIIEKTAEQSISKREGVKGMVSRLGTLTEDWTRDFGRISDYIMNNAYQEGRARKIEENLGKDALVYKDVFPGACKHCIPAYLTNGLGSQPRVFKLSALRANGTNIGKKTIEWRPVLGSMHPWCFPTESTEFYTNEGFKYLKDIRGDEKILSLDLETKNSVWVNINKVIYYNYQGRMLKLGNLISTPNHKQVVIKKKKVNKEIFNNLELHDDSTLGKRVGLIKGIPNYRGSKEKVIHLFGVDFETTSFVSFLAYYLSEGNITPPRKEITTSYFIKISQNKGRWFDDILKVSRECFGVDCCTKETNSNAVYIRIENKDLGEWFKNFGFSGDKFIPKFIKELDKEYLELFLEKYINGDGTRKKVKGWKNKYNNEFVEEVIYTKSLKMRDDLGELIIKIGKTPKFEKTDIFVIRINKYINTYKEKEYLEKWEGEVGCLELETINTLLIKVKGEVFWSGNCRCELHSLPEGYVWDEKLKQFVMGEYKRKVERKSKIKIYVGDKYFES